ncbi:L,D-transpeptidase family protein [Chthonobacter rhizosphaerae]|uniref:L,D-transpeptidase family protein n=1 Tax=Chthonobacter rhizosphaerae TaxID=2735553 RepID=UPI0015EE48FC|nr:L,D-transpeptidase family protein [Chthonobacter rhizosphaerae]
MHVTHAKVKTARGAITRLSLRVLSSSARRGRLEAPGVSVPCALGRTGITRLKREGDGATPAGGLRILGGWYRPDRFRVRPAGALPLRPLRRDDGWGDDPADRNYNRWVRRPYPSSHEALWRDDGLYGVVLVLDWNLRPRARGRGSAIFFHLERPDGGPTAGCVAVSEADMRRLLARLAPGAVLHVGGGPGRPLGSAPVRSPRR